LSGRYQLLKRSSPERAGNDEGAPVPDLLGRTRNGEVRTSPDIRPDPCQLGIAKADPLRSLPTTICFAGFVGRGAHWLTIKRTWAAGVAKHHQRGPEDLTGGRPNALTAAMTC
jgi:hypothetical protein